MSKTSLILILSLSLAPLAANAALPSALEGTYTFQNQIRAAKTVRKERVYSPSVEGQARIAELTSQGYSCLRSSPQFHLCKKELTGLPFPHDVSKRIARIAENTGNVVFHAMARPPELIFEGDIAQEWEIPQPVTVGSRDFASHRRLLSRGIEKVKLGTAGSGSSSEFVYEAPTDQLLFMVAVGTSNGPAFEDFIGYALFERE